MLKDFLYNRWSAALVNRYLDMKLRGVKSFIFVATTGRSGTLTLVDVFSQLENCVALHEPYPSMHDRILRAASYGEEKQVDRFYEVRKSVNIRRAAIGSNYYLEANHLFIKTFIKQAVDDFGERLNVIHLVRDPAKVANSIYALKDQPGTEAGNRWWLDYRAPANLIRIAEVLESHSEFSHPYYKALWYWFETESRIERWKLQLPNVPFVLFHTEDFANETSLNHLFHSLDIPVPAHFAHQVCSIQSHARSHQKLVPPLPDSLAREKMQAFKSLLVEKGLSLPETLSRYE